MKLRIGTKLIEVEDLMEAQQVYCEQRDESGEGATTFPPGQVFCDPRTLVARISYNGRVWDPKGEPIEDPI